MSVYAGIRAHLVAANFAALLMLVQHRGLIINTVANDMGFYPDNLLHDAAKSAIIRMSFGMAEELQPHGIAAQALAPEFLLRC
ncbi:MAG: hypothetical protein EHM14_01770 [Methanothrix sp.]|nr:MAG: hypothetical protein EHM14_01770 [Methanothrix sp.]